MAYATVDDMKARFGADEIDALGNTTVIVAAISDAEAEIDARLAMAWDVPLPAPGSQYSLLIAVTCDLARLRLYSDDPTSAVLKRAELADSRLDQLIDGKRELVGDTAGRVARRQTANFSQYDEPDATRRNLRRDASDTGKYF